MIVSCTKILYFILLIVANYLICVERSFFRDSASCCSCCVHVVVAAHDYQNRDKVSTSSSLLPKAASDLSGGSRKMQFLLANLLANFSAPGANHFMQY